MTTAGIGVITSRASCSCRWKTPPSMPASPGSRRPRWAPRGDDQPQLLAVWCSSRSRRGRRRRRADDAVGRRVGGDDQRVQRDRGRVAAGGRPGRASRSALAIASIFGDLLAEDHVQEGDDDEGDRDRERRARRRGERPPKSGSISSASAGSPRKPMPSEAIVIPTWQVASVLVDLVELLDDRRGAGTRLRRAAARVGRGGERTSANSAATKKPLIAINSSRRTSRRTLIGYVARYFGLGRRRPFGVRNIAGRSSGIRRMRAILSK